MPRRKGYGIPPTKRINVEDEVENNENEIKNTTGSLENTSNETQKPHIENDSKGSDNNNSKPCPNGGSANGIKYLHKKFKKMAAVLLSDDNCVQTQPMVAATRICTDGDLSSPTERPATDAVTMRPIAAAQLSPASLPGAAVTATTASTTVVTTTSAAPVIVSTAMAPVPVPLDFRPAVAFTPSTAATKTSVFTYSSLPESTRTDVLAGTHPNNVLNLVHAKSSIEKSIPHAPMSAPRLAAPAKTATASVCASYAATLTPVPSRTGGAPPPAAVAAVLEDEHGMPATSGRYVCPYCKLVCNKPSVLEKHIRAHTNERPYPCHPCGLAFKTKSNLYKHFRTKSHTLKLEESGESEAKTYNPEEGSMEVVHEEEQQQQMARVENTSNVDDRTEQPRTSIYKPKFHKAAIYIQNSESKSEHHQGGTSTTPTAMMMTTTTTTTMVMITTPTLTAVSTVTTPITTQLNKLGLQLKIPATQVLASLPSSRSTPSTPSSFGGGSSPSPEFLQRHISKLISENQAIVETTDPFWSKKFFQRNKEGPPSSPLPVSTSPNPEVMKKKPTAEEKLPMESKLAYALLQPRPANVASMESQKSLPLMEESQPLNLTISKDAVPILAEKSIPKVFMEVQESEAGYRSQKLAASMQRLNVPNKKFHPYPVVENGRKRISMHKGIEFSAIKKEDTAASRELQPETKKEYRETPAELVADFKSETKEMKTEIVVEMKEEVAAAPCAAGNAKFLRPTSLPLKPGTFVPKKLTPGAVAVLPLISPETPRPNKSYGQLYIGGNAYTYLGLKCSTRSTFCTLHKSQPTYVPLSPEHNKISMYSNWMVRSEVDPYLREVPATKAMACYDSRQQHSYSFYCVAHGKTKDAVTHSSYWHNKFNSVSVSSKTRHDEENKENSVATAEKAMKFDDSSKSLKMTSSKAESSDDYTYIRGRGRGKYVCTECGIRCRKPSMLRKHCRTHTDMRPYKCNHCIFSFKTKGNLTKHMKSKGHYRKCIELGIDPVPTIVDESNVDEELLLKQAHLMEEGQEIDESEEEEDDDDDEEEEDNEDDISEEDPKCQLEREVAKSLLSLSKMSHQTVSEQYANAGLVPLNARPNTYPYNYSATAIESSKPHTPTLMFISEQKERETVSKNTGLARELQSTLQSSQLMKQKCSSSENSERCYFGSSSNKEKSKEVSNVTECNNKNAVTFSSVFPIDLSSKHVLERKTVWPSTVNNVNSNGISEILTPVSEPVLLATICSTTDRLSAAKSQPTTPVTPHTPDPTDGGSAMLQTYLKERAVQDVKIKQQYQAPHIKVDQREFDLKYNAYNEAFNLGVAAAIHASLPLVDKADDVRVATSPKRKNNFVFENNTEKLTIEKNKLKPDRISDSDSKENFTWTPSEVPEKNEGSPSVITLAGSSNSNTHNPAKKMKTEFISPCNGRIQKFSGVIDDERRKCTMCNKVFNKPSQLTLHMNVHYVGKPFKCDACGISFQTKGLLHKHLGSNAHLNKVSMNSAASGQTSADNPRCFKCDDCCTGFRIKGFLAKHLRSKMHIMKLECLGKLPFGTYAEMERCGINMNDIDTTDCENSLKSLQRIAKGVIGSVVYVNNSNEE